MRGAVCPTSVVKGCLGRDVGNVTPQGGGRGGVRGRGRGRGRGHAGPHPEHLRSTRVECRPKGISFYFFAQKLVFASLSGGWFRPVRMLYIAARTIGQLIRKNTSNPHDWFFSWPLIWKLVFAPVRTRSLSLTHIISERRGQISDAACPNQRRAPPQRNDTPRARFTNDANILYHLQQLQFQISSGLYSNFQSNCFYNTE